MLHTKAFTHRDFTQRSLYTLDSRHCIFYTQRPLRTKASTPTQRRLWHRSFYTQKLLDRETVTQRNVFAHAEALSRRNFSTKNSLHRGAFTHAQYFYVFFTQRSLYTELRREVFAQRNFYTQNLYTGAVTQSRFYTGAFARGNF